MPSGSITPSASGSHRLARLLAAARDGSESKLGELLEQTRQYLLLVANRSLDRELRQKQAASDLVQETFLEARRNFAEFRGLSEAELFAWLCRILENKRHDAARRYRRAAMRDIRREQSLDDSAAALDNMVADPAQSPSAVAAVREHAAELHAALARLPEVDRQVIQLRSFERLAFAEVGQQLGCSAGAVRKRWVRAIARLEQELTTADERPSR